jgi:predicted small lipoprotein YifL
VSAVRRRSVLLAACSAVLVMACGQKGPLTLPDKSTAVVTTPQATSTPAAPAPAAAPTDKDKVKDKDKNASSQPPQ